MTKLIIIRGPSGAGKSSVAKALLEGTSRPSLLVSVDQIRNLFSDQAKPAHQASKDMVANNVFFGLEYSYDVILEGILGLPKEHLMLDKFLKVHPAENYIFYLNVSFTETLKRHQTRPEKSEFGRKEMRQYSSTAAPMSHASETIIPEHSSLEETVAIIRKTANI